MVLVKMALLKKGHLKTERMSLDDYYSFEVRSPRAEEDH